jgi:hypothetical protein
VRISEVLTHSEPSARDAIELHNAGAAPVDVGGWLLTDDADVPRKFVIPAGTVISPGEYLVFDEADFNPVPGVPPSFSLSSLGEEVWLFSADSGGNLAGYAHGFAFPAAAPGETFGRYLTSTGEEHFPPQSAASIGAANAGPRVGPVVISEILYRPTTQGVEFVEIHNASDAPVALFDPANPTNCWRISGVGFVFPTGQVLEAGAVAVVAATSPAAFAASRALPPDAALYGPFAGRLDDAGDTLALLRPDPPDPLDPGGPPPEILVDRVRYRNAAPWPVPPAGAGRSLERADARAYGDDPANWRLSAADDGTPGALSLPVVRHAIRTLPTAGGAILPADPLVVHGSNVALEIRADRYYRVVRLLVDGEAQPATNRFTFSGVTNDHTLAAEFAENLAEHGVPERWLAAYALTNRPWNAEAADDQDGDGLPTWQEFVAGTAPTDALSTLRVGCPTHAPVAPVVTWMSVTGRWYAVQAGVPPSPDWAALVHTQGVGGPITITNAVPEAPCVFYRVTVSRERSD